MFTRRHKLTLDGKGDLPEVAQSKPRKKTSDASRDSDEIAKISQDFQVAQLESLKEMGSDAPPITPYLTPEKEIAIAADNLVSPVTKKKPKPANPEVAKPIVERPVKPKLSPKSTPPPKTPSTVAPQPSERVKPPESLLENLLNEIVEQDIQRLRQRLGRKK